MAAAGKKGTIQQLVDTAVEKAAKKRDTKLRLEIGKQPTTVNEWLLAKKKLPKLFTFTEEGDLVSPPIVGSDRGDITIYLPPQISSTVEEQKEILRNRVAEIAEPEEVYAQAKRRLREVVEAYRSDQVSAHDVIEANNDVHQAECILNAKMKGSRFIQEKSNMMERELSFNVYDTMTNPQPVFICEYTLLPWKMFWKQAPTGPQQTVVVDSANETNSENSESNASANDAQASRTGAIIAQRKRAMNSVRF